MMFLYGALVVVTLCTHSKHVAVVVQALLTSPHAFEAADTVGSWRLNARVMLRQGLIDTSAFGMVLSSAIGRYAFGVA